MKKEEKDNLQHNYVEFDKPALNYAKFDKHDIWIFILGIFAAIYLQFKK